MNKISEALKITEFPTEATEFFAAVYERIEADPALYIHLADAEAYYYNGGDYETELKLLAEKTGLHQYTVEMLHLLFCIDRLKGIYKENGYPESLLKETMADLRYKLEECKAVHGVWGTFVFWWFKRFYECKTFKLGRLEFEWEELEFDYDETLKKGAHVINCHIPSAGPLSPELVEDALAQAYEFYGYAKKEETMPVVCESWMLYPPHYELFTESGNMRKFFDRFNVYKHWGDAKNEDAWRIFNRADHDYKQFPQDTELRRNFHTYLNGGKKMGSGYGILFFGPKDAQIARIGRMERILDSILERVKKQNFDEEFERELYCLIDYYEGPMWRKDFETDEAGNLPKELKRGVLSEDAVFNLLDEVQRLREQNDQIPCTFL